MTLEGLSDTRCPDYQPTPRRI